MAEATVIAPAEAKPGREADLERALRAVTDPTHQEIGCRLCALHRGLEDRNTFIMIERWASNEHIPIGLAEKSVSAVDSQDGAVASRHRHHQR